MRASYKRGERVIIRPDANTPAESGTVMDTWRNAHRKYLAIIKMDGKSLSPYVSAHGMRTVDTRKLSYRDEVKHEPEDWS